MTGEAIAGHLVMVGTALMLYGVYRLIATLIKWKFYKGG